MSRARCVRVAGKPHAEAWDSFAGRCLLLQGPVPEDLVVRGVEIPQMVVPQSPHPLIDFGGHNRCVTSPYGVGYTSTSGAGVADAPA